MKKFLKKASAVAGIVVSLSPLLAMAYTPPVTPPPTTPGPVSSVTGVIALLETILGWIATIFWIAAAVFIFYAAFLYLPAAGDAEKVSKASRQFLYAVVAIAVGLMAYGLPVLVNSFLGS